MNSFLTIKEKINNFILLIQFRYSVYKVKQVYKEKTKFASGKIMDSWDRL